MRLRNLDLNLLVTLDALLSERSVTRAAEQLHLSQSAVSGALARLREQFQDELLRPLDRKMCLTPRAEELSRDVRDILLQIENRLLSRPSFSPDRLQRKVSLMASEYMIVAGLPPLIRRFHHIAPGVHFDLHMAYESPSERLNRGTIDFLIIPETHASNEHPKELCFKEEFRCVLWAGNQLVRDTIDLQQYEAMEHIVAAVGRTYRPSHEQQFLDRFAPNRKVALRVPSHVVVPWLLLGTDRIATLQRRLAEQAAQYLPLRVLPVPVEIPPLVEVLQWHRYRSTDEVLMWIKQQMLETITGIGA